MSRLLRGALIGAALLTLMPLAIASAHAELDSASPGPDEVVEGSPTQLVARYTQDIAADRTSIEVRDAAGQTIARGGKDPDWARVQRVDLPPLAPGTYEVRWVTFSTEDDELARGRYRFTVTEAPATAVPTVVPTDPCPSPAVIAASPSADGSPAPVVSAAPTAPPVPTPGATSVVPAASADPLASRDPSIALDPPATPDPCGTPVPSAAPDASPAATAIAASAEASVVP